MAFVLFLLVNFVLLVRPNEFIPGMMGMKFYEFFIVSCLVVSLPQLLTVVMGKSLDTQPITLCVFGLMLAVVLSHVTQFQPEELLNSGVEFAKVVVYYLLVVALLTSPARIRIFVCWMVICIAGMTLVTVLRYHDIIETPVVAQDIDPLARKTLRTDLGNSAAVTDREVDLENGQTTEFRRLRGTGVFHDPNDLALMIVVGLILSMYWLLESSQGIYRLFALLPMGIFLYALYSTYSRGGFLCFVAALGVLFTSRFGWKKSLPLLALVLPVVLLFFAGRMTSINASTGTGQSRVEIWSDGLAALKDAPFFGIGMDQLEVVVGKVAHNSFLHCFTELGLFGGTLFVGTFYFALLMLGRLGLGQLQYADPGLRSLQPFLLAAVAGYCVGMLSLSRSYIVPTYMILGLVTAYINVAACYSPLCVLRFDFRLANRLAMVSIGFLGMSYLFVKIFKV